MSMTYSYACKLHICDLTEWAQSIYPLLGWANTDLDDMPQPIPLKHLIEHLYNHPVTVWRLKHHLTVEGLGYYVSLIYRNVDHQE